MLQQPCACLAWRRTIPDRAQATENGGAQPPCLQEAGSGGGAVYQGCREHGLIACEPRSCIRATITISCILQMLESPKSPSAFTDASLAFAAEELQQSAETPRGGSSLTASKSLMRGASNQMCKPSAALLRRTMSGDLGRVTSRATPSGSVGPPLAPVRTPSTERAGRATRKSVPVLAVRRVLVGHARCHAHGL